MNIFQKLPYFCVNKPVVTGNIESMSEKARRSGTVFRPHFKTHQSLEVAGIFKKLEVKKITVSSLEMADFFASAGFTDITIGIPVNFNLLDEINHLAKQIQLNLVFSDVNTPVEKIRQLSRNTAVYIEIDTGYKRSGIAVEKTDKIGILYRKIRDAGLQFKGFFSHFGNTYSSRSKQEILEIYRNSVRQLTELKNIYQTSISIGDTPSASLLDSFEGVDEIRPGNFVYYDLMQYKLGVCELNDIAAYVMATVIAKYPERKELIIHAGAVHLSKEYLVQDNQKIYGKIAILENSIIKGIESGTELISLSQEHGIVACSDEFFNKTNLYDNIAIIPVHSCLTANLMKNATILD